MDAPIPRRSRMSLRASINPPMALPAIFFMSLWERTHYVECTGASASPPDANC